MNGLPDPLHAAKDAAASTPATAAAAAVLPLRATVRPRRTGTDRPANRHYFQRRLTLPAAMRMTYSTMRMKAKTRIPPIGLGGFGLPDAPSDTASAPLFV